MNIGSLAAQQGRPATDPAYPASKGAVLGLTVSLAHNLGADGICVNAINPGFIRTEIHDAFSDEQLATLAADVPLHRRRRQGWRPSEDIADAVLFLLSSRVGLHHRRVPQCQRRIKDGIMSDGYRISVDIGGTFTDCTVVAPDGAVTIGKSPSTPPEFATGFINSVAAAAEHMGMPLSDLLAQTDRLSHGTTVGINAVVSRTGARVGLISTVGHGDSLRILNNTGRTNGQPVERILDYAASSLPERFVRREDVVEVTERIDAFGEVVVPLDRDGVLRAAEGLLEQGVETLAVTTSGATSTRSTRTRARELLDERYPDLYISYGSQLAQRIGEYPRTATAVLNSYIGPLMRDYVTTLLDELGANGYGDRLLFAQCDGGLIDAEDVIARPVMTLSPGPVGGVVASAQRGRRTRPGEHHRRRHGRDDLRRQRHRRLPAADPRRASWSSSTTSSCGWSTSSRSAPAAAASPGSTPSRARCGSARRARAPTPGRSATAAAAPSRRSPTPTSCSACSTPTTSSAGG